MPVPQKRQPNNLPTAIAYFAYSKLLREFLKPDASFLVCVIVEDDDLFEHHELAIHILMDRRRLARPNHIVRYKIHALFRKSGKTTRVLDDALTERQVIYLISQSADISDELRLAADAIHVVSPPRSKDVRAAVRLLCGQTPNPEDAIFIGGAPWRVSAACFRPERSLQEALRRLQKFATPETIRPSAPSVEQIGEDGDTELPNLEELEGYGEAKSWGLDFKADLNDLRMGQIGWDELDTGLLLSGPPGTGKTMFASILASSCTIPLFPASFAEWQRMGHLGDFFAAMRKTFGDAQDQAPSIVLFDEIDSLGRRGGGFIDRDYMNAALNAFLECLDGSRRRRGVIVIATTNFPDQVDSALLRPGRIGRHIAVDLPGADARVKILVKYLGNPLPPIDPHVIAQLTEGMTGDNLKDIARRAARNARRDRTSLTMDHVLSALPTRIEIPPGQLRTNAAHESGHVIVALEYGRQIEHVRIAEALLKSDRGIQPGGAVRLSPREVGILSASDYLKEITILLGGIAAEQELSGSHADGAGGFETSDLVRATHLATLFVACFGMGRTLVAETLLDAREAAQVRRSNPAIWQEVNETLSRQFAQATDIIKRNRRRLDEVTNALLAERQLHGDDIVRLLAAASSRTDLRVHHLNIRPPS